MSNIVDGYWFMLYHAGQSNVYYFCYAENAAKAFGIFGTLAKGRELIQVTWQQLHDLAGSVIPCNVKPDDFATNAIAFRHKGNYCSFWQAFIWSE